MKNNVRQMVNLATLAALSVLLVYLVRFPIFPRSLSGYDMADVPILIGTFLFGPGAPDLNNCCFPASGGHRFGRRAGSHLMRMWLQELLC